MMKAIFLTLFLIAQVSLVSAAEEAKERRDKKTVMLDESSVKNLGLETAEAEESSFEDTGFALGRIEPIPQRTSVISSRISGRAVKVTKHLGDEVAAGEVVAQVESRQAGDPPPIIPIVAPAHGIVMESKLVVGHPVEPEEHLMEVIDLSEVWAIAQVPESIAHRLMAGSKARLTVPALSSESVEASLLRFGSEADKASNTLPAIFVLPNPNSSFKPGLRVEFALVLESRENVMSIPRQAVQGDGANRFVFIKDYELKDAFVKTPIIIGAMNDSRVEVTQGLLPGDEVVVKGGYSLAFAGKGSTSLKEALDAAHGHPHNEDGTEMTKEQIAASGQGDHDHDHGKGDDHNGSSSLWKASTAILGLLVLIQAFWRKPASASIPETKEA